MVGLPPGHSPHYGIGISDPASFTSIASRSAPCSAAAPLDVLETYSGTSGLQYDGDGYWQFSWRTPRSYAGQCREMQLNLADGVNERFAFFSFN